MIKYKITQKTTIEHNDKKVGETIEQQVQRMVYNNEPISNPVDLIYTERKDGVLPQYDIRADKFDMAIDAMNTASEAHTWKRAKRIEEQEKPQAGASDADGAGTENPQ